MVNLLVKTLLGKILVAVSLLVAASISLGATNVNINGYQLNSQELQALEVQIGSRIGPGSYLANFQTGCWIKLDTGIGNCNTQSGGSGNQQYNSQAGGAYTTRWGSGEQYSDGSWSHYNSLTGNGGVGGTADGCVYAFGWSNC